MTAYDCLIGDAIVVHQDEEAHYTENVTRVAGTYLAFDVAYDVPPVEEAPARRNGYVTFGSFASQYKLTGQVLRAWAAILGGAPEARCLLIQNKAMERKLATASRCCCGSAELGGRTCEGHSRARARLTMSSSPPTRGVDVALDPFPYNGGTTDPL